MSTLKKSSASSSASSSKRGRKSHRRLTDREKLNRQIAHTETQLRNARENRDSSTNDEARASYEKLVKIFTTEVDNLRTKLSGMEEEATERKYSEAQLSAWRNMGKAMPSKTLERDGDTMDRMRDAIAKVASDMSTEAQQAFLAGVGAGVRELSKPSRKKSKKTETEEPGQHNVRLSRSSDRGDESEVDDNGSVVVETDTSQ